MDNTDQKPAARKFPASVPLLMAAIAGPIIWLGLLYPLWPKNRAGWVTAILSGIAVGLYAAMSGMLINWLQRQERHRALFRTLGALIAVSLGLGVFWIALYGQKFITAHFSYFGG